MSSQISLSVPVAFSMPGQELAFLSTAITLSIIKFYLNSISPESLEKKSVWHVLCPYLSCRAGEGSESKVAALWKILAQLRAGGGHSMGSWRKRRRSNFCATANMIGCQQKYHSFSQEVQSTLQTLTHEAK